MTGRDWDRAFTRFNEELGARLRAKEKAETARSARSWVALVATLTTLVILLVTLW